MFPQLSWYLGVDIDRLTPSTRNAEISSIPTGEARPVHMTAGLTRNRKMVFGVVRAVNGRALARLDENLHFHDDIRIVARSRKLRARIASLHCLSLRLRIAVRSCGS